jgi:hypothetical protein
MSEPLAGATAGLVKIVDFQAYRVARLLGRRPERLPAWRPLAYPGDVVALDDGRTATVLGLRAGQQYDAELAGGGRVLLGRDAVAANLTAGAMVGPRRD